MTDETSIKEVPATSTVAVQGLITIRTYSDGSVQRNAWETEEMALNYAASVAEQEGPE